MAPPVPLLRQIHVGPLPQNRSLKIDYPQLRRRLDGAP
jgi:hypothetical protein